ncbi:hypothetical protein Q2941_05565 [Bradyrhizobium sp. UFLA05-153]
MKTAPFFGSAVAIATAATPNSSKPPLAKIHLRFIAALLFFTSANVDGLTGSP